MDALTDQVERIKASIRAKRWTSVPEVAASASLAHVKVRYAAWPKLQRSCTRCSRWPIYWSGAQTFDRGA